MGNATLDYTLAAVAVSFTVSLLLVGKWIRVAWSIGFTARDMNKVGVRAARAGGVWAVVAASFGILVLVMLESYMGGSCVEPFHYTALALLLVLSAFLGFADDILGWKKGLRPLYRVLLMAPISLPLVSLKVGVSRVDLPIVGVVDLGVLYPLVLVPLGVLGAANAFNMIAGYNGLEAGMAILLLSFTGVYASMRGLCSIVPLALVGVAAVAGFAVYNWYPARTFPGNAFTYAFGAYYASLVILGNFEKFGLTLFAMYFAEFALYIRGRIEGVHKENYGVPREDGSLGRPYGGRIYSVTHLALAVADRLTGGRARETHVVAIILAAQAVIGIVALLAYL